MMARDLLVKICSYCGEQVHLVLDKYQSPSIKDAERNLRDIQVLPKLSTLLGLTKPSDKVAQNCSKMFYSKKHLLTSSWRNGRNPNMAQSLEGRQCIFHMVVHA